VTSHANVDKDARVSQWFTFVSASQESHFGSSPYPRERAASGVSHARWHAPRRAGPSALDAMRAGRRNETANALRARTNDVQSHASPPVPCIPRAPTRPRRYANPRGTVIIVRKTTPPEQYGAHRVVGKRNRPPEPDLHQLLAVGHNRTGILSQK
jgi:hypothetical protein